MFRFSTVYIYCLIVLALVSASCAVSKPTPIPPLPSSETDFPLALGNTWVFQATRYEGVPITEIITTTLVITETVVEVKSTSSYFIAQIHREESAEMPVGNVPPSWQGVPLRPATSSEYWLVVSGNRVYRQERNLDPSTLYDTAELELVFPLQVGEKWNLFDGGILRKVVKVDTVAVPAGRFNNCFLFEDAWASDTAQTWFCPNVGIIEEKMDHHGTPMGWHSVLTRYELKR
jgi:hypothetical protein